MKTILLTTEYPPIVGGIGTYVHSLSKELAKTAGMEVEVIAPGMPGDMEFDKSHGPKVSRSGWDHMRFIKMAPLFWTSFRFALKRRDTVFFAMSWMYAGAICWMLHKVFKVPYVVFAYGTEISKWKDRPLPHWLMSRVFLSAQRVFAISNFTASILSNAVEGEMEIELVYGGADTNRFFPAGEGEVVANSPLILTVSRLTKRKGVDTVLRALPLVLKTVPSARYKVIGNGPELQGLQKLAGELGVQDKVDWVLELTDEHLRKEYIAADVMVLANRHEDRKRDFEGLGLVFLEAQACGTPVVAGATGGTADALVDGETGILVDPHSPEEIASAIISILEDPEKRKQMGEKGASWVASERTWKKVAEKVAQSIRGLS